MKDFNDRGINLTKIESRPLRGEAAFRAWFLVEFLGHMDDSPVQEIMHKYGTHLKWLGSYVKVS
ncbi:Prephenate dehydratase [compost metagenome]